MTFRARAEEARRRIIELVDASGDETQRQVRMECLSIYDRWLAGERVDFISAFNAADPTSRDDIIDPLLTVLSGLRLL